jgi:hypothetical protein
MLVTVRRSGGFAGIDEEVGSVDTASLETGAREEVERLVAETDFFALPAALEAEDEIGADQFSYEITVSDGERTHSVAFKGEGPRAEPLRRLVDTAASHWG